MNDKDRSSAVDEAWGTLPGELETELNQILLYWERFAVDREHGGFYGRIDDHNIVHERAPKGSVLHARILWAFSAAYNHTQNPAHLALATRAYQYIRDFMTDREYGGLYWSVSFQGDMLENYKQVYAQAFGIYGLSEYYRATQDAEALELALAWRQLIEKHSRDHLQGGYIDAFARDWSFLEVKRLSEKDENASKTMNTHLHLVEAYANLYTVCPSAELKDDIRQLWQIFDQKIIDHSSHHLGLYFNEGWKMDKRIISYGHDVEAGWLLQACAEAIGDPDIVDRAKINAVQITTAAMEGLDDDGGLWYEYDTEKQQRILEKHWWPQAEALIGFYNAWQLTGNSLFRTAVLKNWQFIRRYILDYAQGEWLWGIDEYGNPMPGQDKVGLWKCPYHNSRACLELLKRLGT